MPRMLLSALLLVPIAVALAACEGEAAPAPVAAPGAPPVTQPTAAPAASLPEGHQLFIAKGCAACHGRDAEGTSIAPAIAGHSAEVVKRQVRQPLAAMPAFSARQVSDEELDEIAEWIAGQESEVEHAEPVEMPDLLAIHHWMAIQAIKADDIQDAIHHVEHILDAVTDQEHRHAMEEALEDLKAGRLHDAEHALEQMLAGKAIPDLTPGRMHLRLALAAIEGGDTQDAEHHMQHFLGTARGNERTQAEEIMRLMRNGHIHDATHMMEEMIGPGGHLD